MNEAKQQNERIKQSLSNVVGIQSVYQLRQEDRGEILALEEEAEKRSLLGLGKVINSGVRRVLLFDSVYVALTDMDFNWRQCSSLILKKGDQLVGEEIHDEAVLAKLSKNPNAWFMHKNFVVYKDLVSFPQDIMRKICHFELPGMSADWLSDTVGERSAYDIWYASPSTFCDIHLKKQYFNGVDERGLGTTIIGVNVIADIGGEEK